jgi:ABC-type multidrug transport system ATPase subunit
LSLLFDFLDKRPLIIALAGSNGAGKSTFYDSYLADGGLRFINADELSASLGMLPYDAAELPHVIVYSNEDLGNPYQFVAYYENGQMIERGTTP